ncbi:hypothetical protein DsansV1_C03g0032821 [Dioscorea sansibarensis]
MARKKLITQVNSCSTLWLTGRLISLIHDGSSLNCDQINNKVYKFQRQNTSNLYYI